MRAIILVRHGSAGHRERWSGDDRERPLDELGWRQAGELVTSLAAYRLDRIVSSPYLRCTQTMEPLAQRHALLIEERGELAEGAAQDDALAIVDELRGQGAALCTHGDMVLELLGREMKKGETAILAP